MLLTSITRREDCFCLGVLLSTFSAQVELVVKNLPVNVGDVCSADRNPGLGRFPQRSAWQPTQVFLPENPMNREAWQITVHRVTKSWIQSDLAHITDLYAENHPSTQFNPWS